MIIGNIKESNRYELLHPLFKAAFEYLKNLDFDKVEAGKIELDGRNLYASVSDSTMKTKDVAKLEVHNKYIDIQMPISQAESMGWCERSVLSDEVAPYNEEKDILFFKEKSKSYITLQPGDFVIFYPEDAHAPCVGEGIVRKVVVKVKL